MQKTNQEILNRVISTIKHRELFNSNTPLMLMVSGGADSVALTYIMNTLRQDHTNKNLAIMHLNHMLRGSAADADEAFVKQIADALNLPIYTYKTDIAGMAAATKRNIEALGHDMRLNCAKEAINAWNPKAKICTAHNQDDRAENFYMRSIVGTGPGGFASMSYKNGKLVRPLLDISHNELINFVKQYDAAICDSQGNRWHEDHTNKDTDRFRAYVRHNIIPLAKDKNPQMLNNLTNSMNLIADESAYIENKAKEAIDSCATFNGSSCHIKPQFKNLDIVIQRRAAYSILKKLFPAEERINSKSVYTILDAAKTHNYTNNIQHNFVIHSNTKGITIQPMNEYRKQRNRL